jgi:hypothetical protein
MAKRVCRQCGKSNAVPPAHLCPTCKRVNRKAASKRAHGAAIFKRYGITGEQYDQIYEAQGRACAICRTSTGASKRLAVDHNHETGEVRGLLCGKCNHRLLGAAHDTTDILKRAIEYLENPPARKLLAP